MMDGYTDRETDRHTWLNITSLNILSPITFPKHCSGSLSLIYQVQDANSYRGSLSVQQNKYNLYTINVQKHIGVVHI